MSEEIAVEYVDEDEPNARPGWHIQDLVSLDWALSRVAALQREMADNEIILDANIARLRQKHAKLNEQAARGVAFFEGRIREYADLNRDALLGGGKRKSRKFVHGSIAWKKRGGGFKVNDSAALLAWAQQQPVELGLVRMKEEPAWDEIKSRCATSGELPPGVDVEPESESFKIEASTLEVKNEH